MTGQTLGHYHVLEKIGAGGMGEVYRAHDQHLERTVAIKVLPLGVLADDATRKRFRREALALSRLNHPNIATVFDFDTQNGVDFLAMEFIDGIPLSDRVAAGALTEAEVLKIGAQLAEGLAAAHAEGVVHRDLKPGNLMIAADGRLKILDFGLAILLQGDEIDLTRSSSDESGVEGTLPYMSPEQVRGRAGDTRSDVYAAGAVLYELATGKRPFPHTHSNELVGAILHESSTRPRQHNAQLSEELDRLITKALHKDPSQRHQSARDLLLAIDGVRATPTTTWRAPRRAVAAAAAAFLVAGLVMVAFNAGGVRDWITGGAGVPNQTANSALRVRRSVAVVGFKNLSGKADEAWVSTALAEMLTTELAAGGQLRAIAGENIARMKINLSLSDAGSYGLDTLKRIRDNLGADDVVLGSYLAMAGGRLRLDFTLQHALTGETINAGVEQGELADLDDLVRRAGAVLRGALDAKPLSNADQRPSAGMPTSLDAVRPFAEGLARLRLFDHLAARDLLEKAVGADPNNPLARVALATAWAALGYDDKARGEAQRAFELSNVLSRENQLAVEGQYRGITAEHDKAVSIYQTLVNFVPDNLDYGLRLASAQIAAGQGKAALTTVDRLRQLPPPMSADPRIDLAEASAAGSLSDYARQRAAAENAAAKGAVLGARLLVAQAQVSTAYALGQQGSSNDAIRSYEKALAAFGDAGDQAGAASVQSAMGYELLNLGEFDKANAMFGEAVTTLKRIGAKRALATALFSLGSVHYRRDALLDARKNFQEALETYREINDRAGMATAFNGLGVVLMDQSDGAGAIRMYQRSLTLMRETGSKRGAATALHNIGMVTLDQADLTVSRARAEEALAIRRDIGDKPGISTSTRLLGRVLRFQGDLTASHKHFAEALALQVQLGQATQAAYTRQELAEALNDEGRAAEAEPLIREAIKAHRAQEAIGEEAYCLRVLAESEMLQSKLAEAQSSIDAANRLVSKVPNVSRRLAIQLTQARVDAANGEVAEAKARLISTMTKAAAETSLTEIQFEARLSLGELELKEGQTAAGRARLSELEAAAKAKGMGLYVDKANAALNRNSIR